MATLFLKGPQLVEVCTRASWLQRLGAGNYATVCATVVMSHDLAIKACHAEGMKGMKSITHSAKSSVGSCTGANRSKLRWSKPVFCGGCSQIRG